MEDGGEKILGWRSRGKHRSSERRKRGRWRQEREEEVRERALERCDVEESFDGEEKGKDGGQMAVRAEMRWREREERRGTSSGGRKGMAIWGQS